MLEFFYLTYLFLLASRQIVAYDFLRFRYVGGSFMFST